MIYDLCRFLPPIFLVFAYNFFFDIKYLFYDNVIVFFLLLRSFVAYYTFGRFRWTGNSRTWVENPEQEKISWFVPRCSRNRINFDGKHETRIKKPILGCDDFCFYYGFWLDLLVCIKKKQNLLLKISKIWVKFWIINWKRMACKAKHLVE